jgi:hypothetical protein
VVVFRSLAFSIVRIDALLKPNIESCGFVDYLELPFRVYRLTWSRTLSHRDVFRTFHVALNLGLLEYCVLHCQIVDNQIEKCLVKTRLSVSNNVFEDFVAFSNGFLVDFDDGRISSETSMAIWKM